VSFRSFDLIDLEEIPDDSHAIVCMGFLLHGLDTEFREQILTQAGRIATHQVFWQLHGRMSLRWPGWKSGSKFSSASTARFGCV